MLESGEGTEISVINDVWILDLNYSILSSHVNNLSDFKVTELIDDSCKKWKKELIASTFPVDVAELCADLGVLVVGREWAGWFACVEAAPVPGAVAGAV